MPAARFRLQRVTVEGFKAFTSEQTVDLSGGHLFIFGNNGCGKSSIIEAIRWALFGLADRPETEVRNAFYQSGDCRVELVLGGSAGQCKLVRRLRPGSGRSDLAITNAQGRSVNLSEAFPHIARLGPREGTHIIYAAQQSSGHRPHADISDFDKILYSYLQLEEIPELIERTDEILEEQEESEKRLASHINVVEEELRRRLQDVDSRCEELLRNPPWGESGVPTTKETEERVRLFVEEIAGLANASNPSETNLSRLLEIAVKWTVQLSQSSRSELQRKSFTLQSKRSKLRNSWESKLQGEREKLEAEKEIEKVDQRLLATLEGKSQRELELDLLARKQSIEKEGRHLLLTQQAKEFIWTFAPSECPICLTAISRDELAARVSDVMAKAETIRSAGTTEISVLQDKYDHSLALELQRQLQVKRLQEAQQRIARVDSELCALLSKPPGVTASETDMSSHLSALDDAIGGLASESQSGDEQSASWKRKIENLREELRFHEYRKQQESLGKRLVQGLEPTRERHREVVELIDTVREIRDRLQQTFNEELDRTFPILDDMMSDVYMRLTNQVSFERVHVGREESPTSSRKLRVSVGSNRSPRSRYNPEDVLNGQALSALRLVPYFVFSHFQTESLEFDFLLIDDPSQSFDTSRVHLLLEELVKASSHAQLIIATHEEDRFGPEIPKYFDSAEVKVLHVAGFEPESGPGFVLPS
jgi:hypothetical protein